MTAPSDAKSLRCHLCQVVLSVRMVRGRKSGKPAVMLLCPVDGRHFRGFITDQAFVRQMLARLEKISPTGEVDPAEPPARLT